jgi:hypothetical protein
MNENQSDCHRSVQQRFRVLMNHGVGPDLNRPTMPAERGEGGGGVGSHTTLVI